MRSIHCEKILLSHRISFIVEEAADMIVIYFVEILILIEDLNV